MQPFPCLTTQFHPVTRSLTWFIAAAMSLGCASSQAQTPTAPHAALLRFDFNDATPWPKAATDVMPSTPIDVATSIEAKPVGTIDKAGSTEKSGAMLLKTAVGEVGLPWIATYNSGLLPLKNGETDLKKLTLSLDLSASGARPVLLRVESFSARKLRTGGLETTLVPAAPDFFQRFALELSALKPAGAGQFNPTDPFLQLSFELKSPAWPDKAIHEVRLDNLQLATPALYVSPTGDDKNDGKTEKTALATPQKALDGAQPGDIIVLMNGTYHGGLKSVAAFGRAGTPAAWIVLKNLPGHTPTLSSNAWNIVQISKGSKEAPDATASLAYLEVRGLHIRGESDLIKEKFPDAIGKPDGRSNTNGIAVDGRYMKNVPHHIRLADNIVEWCPAQGLGSLEGDWISIENNISRFNCWTTIYGTSGISLMGAANFDGADGPYKNLIRGNICHRNETFVPWAAVKRISDGNGIILDVNQKTDTFPNGSYLGRTLVQNNLVFDNGGSGIHTVRAKGVDIINNTAYHNSASKSLEYSQIYSYGSDDVRIFNNIMVARVADLAAGEKPEPVNRISGPNTNVVFGNNLYFGGNIAPTLGEGDQIADPGFVKVSTDGKIADFRLQPGSPALKKGRVVPFSPFFDRDGQPRGAAPSVGAY